MKHILLKALLIVFTFGMSLACNYSNSNKNDTTTILVKTATDLNLEDIAQDVKVISIKSNQAIGRVKYVKCYGEEMFLLGERKIYYLKNGELISTLDAVGRGHGEYSSISSFAYNKERQELIIADKFGILLYEIPTMNYLKSIELDGYINAIETLDKDNIVITRESKTDGSFTLERVSLDNPEKDILISGEFFSLEMMNDCSFSPNKEGTLLFFPGLANTLYQITANTFDSIYKYDFGKNNLPEKYYKWTPKKGKLDLVKEVSENHCVVLPLFAINSSRQTSFWFVCDVGKVPFALPPMMMAYISPSKSYVANSLRISGINGDIQPCGVNGEYYVSLLYGNPDQIENKNQQLSELASNIINAAKTQNDYNPIILLYKLK